MPDIKTAVTRATTRSGTGTQDFTVSGFGTPKAALIIAQLADTDGTPIADAYLCVGAVDGTRQWCGGSFSDDAQVSVDSSSGFHNASCLRRLSASSFSVDV